MCFHVSAHAESENEQFKTNKSGMASENLKTSDKTITQVKDGK